MEQYNRTTKPHISTTNWYLYRSYLKPLCAKPKDARKKTTNNDKTQKQKEKRGLQNNVNNNTGDFKEILLEAIDEGLSILGDSAKNAVYNYLEKTFKMSPQDIPCRIEEYIIAIENIFGTGAKIIQIQTMRKLYHKVGKPIEQYPEQQGLRFIEYIETIKLEKALREKLRSQQPN
jgi:hypothetical protein